MPDILICEVSPSCHRLEKVVIAVARTRSDPSTKLTLAGAGCSSDDVERSVSVVIVNRLVQLDVPLDLLVHLLRQRSQFLALLLRLLRCSVGQVVLHWWFDLLPR